MQHGLRHSSPSLQHFSLVGGSDCTVLLTSIFGNFSSDRATTQISLLCHILRSCTFSSFCIPIFCIASRDSFTFFLLIHRLPSTGFFHIHLCVIYLLLSYHLILLHTSSCSSSSYSATYFSYSFQLISYHYFLLSIWVGFYLVSGSFVQSSLLGRVHGVWGLVFLLAWVGYGN